MNITGVIVKGISIVCVDMHVRNTYILCAVYNVHYIMHIITNSAL